MCDNKVPQSWQVQKNACFTPPLPPSSQIFGEKGKSSHKSGKRVLLWKNWFQAVFSATAASFKSQLYQLQVQGCHISRNKNQDTKVVELLWGKFQKSGNPQLSTSILSGKIQTYGNPKMKRKRCVYTTLRSFGKGGNYKCNKINK